MHIVPSTRSSSGSWTRGGASRGKEGGPGQQQREVAKGKRGEGGPGRQCCGPYQCVNYGTGPLVKGIQEGRGFVL